jgi:hypothetical protein
MESKEESGEPIKRSRISPWRILFSALSCLLALFFSYALVTDVPRDFRNGSGFFLDNLVFCGFGAFSFWMITIGLICQSKWPLWCGLSAMFIGGALLQVLPHLFLPDYGPRPGLPPNTEKPVDVDLAEPGDSRRPGSRGD